MSSKTTFVRASCDHLAMINSLIRAAKSHWNYPKGYLSLALKLLEIDETYLSENLCFEIHDRGKIVGFSAVMEKNREMYLDHLWIHPESHKSGFGRLACERIFEIGKKQGWHQLFVLPDPLADGFYKRLGFLGTGIQVPSRIEGGPTFNLLKIHLRDN